MINVNKKELIEQVANADGNNAMALMIFGNDMYKKGVRDGIIGMLCGSIIGVVAAGWIVKATEIRQKKRDKYSSIKRGED